jgi:hypothetical protein
MKVAKPTQTRPTPFQGGIPRTYWWYWFKCRRFELNICQAKRLDISGAQGLTIQSCLTFYQNLKSLYNKHNYVLNHIWNSNGTGIQARR